MPKRRGARAEGDHRRRRRRGAPARHAGREDDGAGARRAGRRAGTSHGVDSLHSIVQMPKGMPVATFAIGAAGAANAALFAVAMLANDRCCIAREARRVPPAADRSGARDDADAELLTRRVVLPGATLGVMGGGQLGRMFVHAAQAMGYRTSRCSIPIQRARRASSRTITSRATTSTSRASRSWCGACAAITTEFENVPAQALRRARRARGRSRRAPTRWRSARTAPPRRRSSRAAACRVRRMR